jgi:glycolate oxidase
MRSGSEDRSHLVRELETAAGRDAVMVERRELEAFAADESGAEAVPPDVVVRPADTKAVAGVLAVASRLRVPVVPVGGRTGLAGGAIPRFGGIALSLERLDRIEPVDRDSLRVSVGAGARTGDVQRAALAAGLFYPPDPAALDRSTIGGNVATNAGGPRCFKYGVTAEYVLALEAVTADGRVFRTGAATRKNATGLRLAQLLVGSEGTLAVVTAATLRLVAAPGARAAATASFDSVGAAGEAVAAIVRSGLVPSALELLDSTCLALLREHTEDVPIADGAALLLAEVDGPDERSVAADLERLDALLTGARTRELATGEEDVERLWAGRRGLSAALVRSTEDYLFQDVCVPVAAVPEALRRIEEIAARYALRIPVFAHAGDGNLHPSILYDAAAGDQAERAHAAERDLLRAALVLGGTISAEHGIGLLKLPFLGEDLDPVAIDQMRRIKRALDPNGILNPGKLLPPP